MMASILVLTAFFDVRDFPTGPRVRHGDLLPLPMPKDDFFSGAVAELRSRRSRHRVATRRSVQAGMEDTVRALNQLAGFDDERSWPSRILNQAQIGSYDQNSEESCTEASSCFARIRS